MKSGVNIDCNYMVRVKKLMENVDLPRPRLRRPNRKLLDSDGTAVASGRLGETPLPPRGKSIAPNRGLPRPKHQYNSKTRKTAQFGISVIHRFRMPTQRRSERRDTAYSPRVPEEEPSGDGMLLPSLLRHWPN